jgi:chorismate synthase
MQVEPLDEAASAELAGIGDRRQQACRTGHPRPARSRRSGRRLKYGFSDVRNVLERASARETAARVAAGGVARAFLRELGIEAWSFTAEVGGVAVDPPSTTRSRDEATRRRCAAPIRRPRNG